MVVVAVTSVYRLYDATGKFFLATNTETDIVPVCEFCALCVLRQMIKKAIEPRPFSKLKSITISVS